MGIQVRLFQLAVALSRKGHLEEACQLRMVAHYNPEEGDDVPSFWRKNNDYGEGLFHGDMSEKPSTEEWLKKYKRKKKEAAWPKKKDVSEVDPDALERRRLWYEELQGKVVEMMDYLRKMYPDKYGGMEYAEMADISGPLNFAYDLSIAMRGLPRGKYVDYRNVGVQHVTDILEDLGRTPRTEKRKHQRHMKDLRKEMEEEKQSTKWYERAW